MAETTVTETDFDQLSWHDNHIHGIAREVVADQKISLGRPYYRWRIETNWPKSGLIAFGASGFTQTLRATPVLTDEPKLPPLDRAPYRHG